MEAESDLYEATLEAAPEPAAVSEPVETPVATETPAWLAELANEETEPQPIAELETIWTPPAEPPLEMVADAPLEPEAAPVAKETAPAPVVAEPIEVEPEPAVAETPAVPAWMAEEPIAEPPEPPVWIQASAVPPVSKTVGPEPVRADEAPAQEKAPKAPKAAKKPKAKSTSRPPRKRAGVAKPAKLRRTEAPEVVLALAREQLSGDKLKEAVEVYGELIASNQLIGDIITDLEAAAFKRPEQPELLRTLGDAYMRDNQLQRALDAYKQALRKL
jgi:hypothetical protein